MTAAIRFAIATGRLTNVEEDKGEELDEEGREEDVIKDF